MGGAARVDLEGHHELVRLPVRPGGWHALLAVSAHELNGDEARGGRRETRVGQDGNGRLRDVAGRHEEHEGAGEGGGAVDGGGGDAWFNGKGEGGVEREDELAWKRLELGETCERQRGKEGNAP